MEYAYPFNWGFPKKAMAQLKQNPIQSRPEFAIPENKLVASAATNNPPDKIEIAFVILGFKMKEICVLNEINPKTSTIASSRVYQ